MTQIYVENPRKILREKKEIEKTLDIKFSIKENILQIQAQPEKDFIALEFFEALNLGFKIPDALLLKEEEIVFEKINIKDHTKRNDLAGVRGRIIGRHRKSLDTLENLTNCIIALKDNSIGIIGRKEDIEKANLALIRIIKGAKHSNIYSHLEKINAEERTFL